MASKRSSISTFLAQAKNLKVELSKLVIDPAEVIEYINKFDNVVVPSSKSIQSFAKLFHRSENGSFDIKIKTFGTNATSLFNERIRMYQLNDKIKLISSKIEPIAMVPQTATKIEIVTRFAFELINYPNWMIQIDLVKNLDNPLEFGSKLSTVKTLLVDTTLDKMDASAYDYVVTTLICIDDSQTIMHSDLNEMINDINDSQENSEIASPEYQAMLYSLAKDIFRDAITISQFKRQSGFKRLGSNTIELSRPIYFKQVLPVIDTFYLTDKMDGTRAMLIIDEVYRRSGHRRIFIGVDIKAISDKIYEISSFHKPPTSKTIEIDHTVLDVEMMTNSKGEHTFHCFDIIALDSKRVANSPFKDRINKFDKVKALLEKYELGDVKEFVKLSKQDYSTQIKEFYNKSRSYHIDGIILTPEGSFYKDAIKQKKSKFDRVFNTDYSSTVSFKWKPLDQLTIDFYLMSHPTKKGSYILCSGIDTKTFQQLRLKFFDGYNPPVSPNSHKYFPIQFEPYDGTFDYVWTPSEVDEKLRPIEYKSFDGMVGEFAFADSKGHLNSPKLLRLRTDRIHDIAKGEYYGNAMRYAELIWHSIQYPLRIEDMYNPTNVGYFAMNDDTDWYKAQRNFNSFVKTNLLETYLYPKSSGTTRIMDIACGKGQDLARAIDIGYDEIIAMDRDIDALYELLERKYNLRVRNKGVSANVHIKKVDLEESADANIKSLKIPSGSVDSAMINFAIHYICHSAIPGKIDPLEEFVQLVKFYLKSGGRIMITAFNGEDIFNILKNKDEWSQTENGQLKYSIKRAFSSDVLTDKDQAIDVLLPFSAGEYYREYLVNYDYLQKLFESHGFKTIKTDSFGSLLRSYKKQNQKGYSIMSEADQHYVSLYGYIIFERE